MWRNTAVVDFVAWLRRYNDSVPETRQKCGFYGLDLYSLHASAHAVIEFLEKVDPEAAKRARYRLFGVLKTLAKIAKRMDTPQVLA